MTASSYGTKGEGVYDGSGAPDPAIDASELAAYAALVGNRKIGTRLERLALTDNPGAKNKRWPGLVFFQTDGADKGAWIFLDGDWKRERIDFEYQQDGEAPAGFVIPPTIQASNELIVKFGTYRFITTPQAEIGSEWAPTKSFVTPFPNGVDTVQITPIYTESTPAGPPDLNSQSKNAFRVIYPGFVGTRQRAFDWLALGH